MAVVQQQQIMAPSFDHLNGDDGLFKAVVGSASSPKAEGCRIVLQKFDNYGRVTEYPTPSVSFYPGEPIYGYVEIDLGKTTKARAIRIRFMGYERVHWTTGSGKNRRHHIKVVVYYNSRQTVWTPPKDVEHVLPAGRYRFYWTPFVLPFPIGPSYQGARGIIHHLIQTNIDIPMKTDIKSQINITVVPIAFIPETVKIPQMLFRREKKFLGSSSPIIIETCLLNSVTLPGGTISFFMKLDNQNKDKKINEVRISVLNVQQFRTDHNRLTLNFPVCYRVLTGENKKAFLEPLSKFEGNVALQIPNTTHFTNFFTYTMSNRIIVSLEFVTSGMSTNVTAVLGEIVVLPLFAIPPPPFYTTLGLKEWHGELHEVYPHISWLELRQRQMDYEKAKFFIPQIQPHQFKVGDSTALAQGPSDVNMSMESHDGTEYLQAPIQSWNPPIESDEGAVLLQTTATQAIAFKDLTTTKEVIHMEQASPSSASADDEGLISPIPLTNDQQSNIGKQEQQPMSPQPMSPVLTTTTSSQAIVADTVQIQEFRTFYTELPKRTFLFVKVVEAKDLENHEIIGKSDPYVKMQMMDVNKVPYLRKVKTKVVKSNLNPTWNESFTFFVLDPKLDSIFFEVMDKDVVSDDKMGCATFAIGSLPTNDKTQHVLKLEKAKRGTITIEFSWQQ